MSNWWVFSWLVIDYWRWPMSNRNPKILWPINYSSMTSISHWCNWLLIDDPSITHRLLYCAGKTLFLLSSTIFSFVILFSVLDAFFLISELPVDDVEQLVWKWNLIKYADKNRLRGYQYFLWVFVSKVKLLQLRETSLKQLHHQLEYCIFVQVPSFGLWPKRDFFIF